MEKREIEAGLHRLLGREIVDVDGFRNFGYCMVGTRGWQI